MNIIKELWYGNIAPQNEGIYSTPQMKELTEYMARHREALVKTLSNEQKDLFDKFMDNRNEYDALAEANGFEYGFKQHILLKQTTVRFLKNEKPLGNMTFQVLWSEL